MDKVDLLIVGAGWNGLAIAKTYVEAHPEASILIFDYAESIGGTWAAERVYPGLKTNNIVGSYEFSDFPLVPKQYGIEAGQHIPGSVVHRYLCNFARQYGLDSYIRFRTKVETATLLPNGLWQIDYATSPATVDNASNLKADLEHGCYGQLLAWKLVLATGLTSEPYMPTLPGRDLFKGHVFHAKEFKSRAEDISHRSSVVVIGGNKSAWDVCYTSAARYNADAHMVMRRSGGGPSWVWPAKIPGFFTSLAALSATRLVSWLDPSPFGPSARTIRAMMNRTWLGQKLISLFWNNLDSKVISLNSYNDHPGTMNLNPWTSTYWMGNSLSIHNYETRWFDLAKSGKITAHAAEVVSLSEHTVHLSDGTSIRADAVVCCTGWEARPNIKFLPEDTASRIGFPNELTDNSSLETQVRGEIFRWAPMLRNPPIRQLPHLEPEVAAQSKVSKAVKTSPYRLYRFMVPYDKDFIQRHNFAVIGAHITIHTAILSQAQALWITSYLDGKTPHLGGPDEESDYSQIMHDTFYHTEFERIRRPREAGGAGERYPDLVVDSIPYVDMLLSDLQMPYHRKRNWYREVVEPYNVSDYKGLVKEWISLQRT